MSLWVIILSEDNIYDTARNSMNTTLYWTWSSQGVFTWNQWVPPQRWEWSWVGSLGGGLGGRRRNRGCRWAQQSPLGTSAPHPRPILKSHVVVSHAKRSTQHLDGTHPWWPDQLQAGTGMACYGHARSQTCCHWSVYLQRKVNVEFTMQTW
jgi:hypothetical protein